MITATYTVAASPWTQAIDAALLKWSAHLVGSANLNIAVQFDSGMGLLASAGPRYWHTAGALDGVAVHLPSATVDIITGGNRNGVWNDLAITINPTWDWHFGDPSTTPLHQYSAVSVMLHELGHGLFMLGRSIAETPYEIWANENADIIDPAHEMHLLDSGSAMYWQGNLGPGNEISAVDIIAAGGSGLATVGDDLIYLPNISGLTIDAGAGHDTAIWLHSFNAFDAHLVNIEALSLRGTDPLTVEQQELYRLYEAAFGRLPDLDGFTYWAGSGDDIVDLSIHFAASDEFNALYPTGDRAEFLTALYWNVHDRAPDHGGYAYWMGRTDMDDAGLLRSFALSHENGLTGPVDFFL